MDGVIVVNKEKDYTSRDVVNLVSKYLGVKKVGHTGTLDPLATGVLVIVLGKATKLVEYLTSTEKEYIADVVLGVDTDTLDITGTVIQDECILKTEEEIKDGLILGTYLQEVPKYSAVKVNGRKLYEYARNGIEVILPKKEVTIREIELLKTWEDRGQTCFQFRTVVSKGTYIRSLIRDIASNLGTNGVMTALKRTRQGVFTLEGANTLEDIKNGKYKLISLLNIFSEVPKVEVTEEIEKKIRNGNLIKDNYHCDQVVFTKENHVLALYKSYLKEPGYLKPEIMF